MVQAEHRHEYVGCRIGIENDSAQIIGPVDVSERCQEAE